ncbi:putative JmjC domain, F-box-like domain superfamily protein [Plasmopara halstedii]
MLSEAKREVVLTRGSTDQSLKRIKTIADHDNDSTFGPCSPCERLKHPHGVKPIGNFFEDTINGVMECRTSGLGRLAMLQDSQLLLLLNHLSAKDLAILAACSRSAYVYSMHDELWRVLVLEEMKGNFIPNQTWRATYVMTKFGDKMRTGNPIRVQGVYSDLLFQSFYCSVAPIDDAWLAVDNIQRRSAKTMTVADFKSMFERPNVPVIITDAINDWAALHKWTDNYLSHVCKEKTLYAGGFQFPIEKYFDYCRTLLDDQPLFVFDKEFATKVPQLAQDYTVPAYFQDDYFALLGEDKRPDYRWLIIGPKKSGSSFHIDPNATNAWNGVIRGAKKWIMFPPGNVPPGIHPSEDGAEVSSPISLMEWFVTFYKDVQKLPPHLKPVEGICKEGEIVFVPHGWWHTVLNIDESIAITQNFVSANNVKNVVRFLKEKPEQVSGCSIEQRSKLSSTFQDVLSKNFPDLHANVVRELKEEEVRKHRKSKWEMLMCGEHDSDKASSSLSSNNLLSKESTFSFGFNFD